MIDDGSLVRRLLATELARTPDFNASACSSAVADVRAQLLGQHPDVILFNLDNRATDPSVLLAKLQMHYPVPIIAYADLRTADRKAGVRAIERGVVDVLQRPPSARPAELAGYVASLAPRIRSAFRTVRPVQLAAPRPTARASFTAAGLDPRRFVVALGASTGGTEAIRVFLAATPADFAPIVIVQHMPAGFTRSFADRLNLLSPLRVAEATDGEPLRSGCALVARGDTQFTVARAADGWVARYTDQTPVNGHCPSVNVLFSSVAAAGPAAVGVLLTGMGADGATGLLRLRRAGGLTLAQDASSCVVYGMPRAAVELGAAELVGAPAELPGMIVAGLVRRRRAAPVRTAGLA